VDVATFGLTCALDYPKLFSFSTLCCFQQFHLYSFLMELCRECLLPYPRIRNLTDNLTDNFSTFQLVQLVTRITELRIKNICFTKNFGFVFSFSAFPLPFSASGRNGLFPIYPPPVSMTTLSPRTCLSCGIQQRDKSWEILVGILPVSYGHPWGSPFPLVR